MIVFQDRTTAVQNFDELKLVKCGHYTEIRVRWFHAGTGTHIERCIARYVDHERAMSMFLIAADHGQGTLKMPKDV